MKKHLLTGAVSGIIGLSLLVPQQMHAEDTPPDAPYQEVVEEPTEPTTETVEPTTDSQSPTLPQSYSSPATPEDPEASPATPSTPPTTSITTTPAEPLAPSKSVKPKRITPIKITRTLTPASIQRSAIWRTDAQRRPDSTSLTASSAVANKSNSNLGLVGVGLGLIRIGAVAGIRHKRHSKYMQ